MKYNWNEITLDKLYEISSGLSKKREEFGFGHEFLTFKEIFHNPIVPNELNELANTTENERNRCSIKYGDVFLTRTSENFDELGLSSVALKDYPDATFNGFTKRLRPNKLCKEIILPNYAVFYFRSVYFRNQVTSFSSMTTRASLNNEMISKLTIIVPPLIVQKGIANILMGLLKKEQVNIKTINILEELSQTLFKRWFIDFEFPNDEGLPYKSSGGRMVESELGKIPDIWVLSTLGAILEKTSEKVGDRDVVAYATTNTGLYPREEKYKKDLSKSMSKNKVIRQGYIVFGMSRQILNFGVMLEKIGCVSPAYHIYKINEEMFLPDLLDMYIRIQEPNFRDLIKPGAREGQGIDTKAVDGKVIVLPDKDIQLQFVKIYSDFKQKIEIMEKENKLFKEIRDNLLPKLFSGEIEIPDESVVD